MVDKIVRVGVTCIIVKNGKILLGLRSEKCETAKDVWAYPGGRMEYGEHPVEAIQREIQEEAGIDMLKKDFEFLCWKNEFFPEQNKHYITLVFFAKCPPSLMEVPVVMEPDMCREWKWFDPENLPENVFWAVKENTKKYIEKIKNN